MVGSNGIWIAFIVIASFLAAAFFFFLVTLFFRMYKKQDFQNFAIKVLAYFFIVAIYIVIIWVIYQYGVVPFYGMLPSKDMGVFLEIWWSFFILWILLLIATIVKTIRDLRIKDGYMYSLVGMAGLMFLYTCIYYFIMFKEHLYSITIFMIILCVILIAFIMLMEYLELSADMQWLVGILYLFLGFFSLLLVTCLIWILVDVIKNIYDVFN